METVEDHEMEDLEDQVRVCLMDEETCEAQKWTSILCRIHLVRGHSHAKSTKTNLFFFLFLLI